MIFQPDIGYLQSASTRCSSRAGAVRLRDMVSGKAGDEVHPRLPVTVRCLSAVDNRGFIDSDGEAALGASLAFILYTPAVSCTGCRSATILGEKRGEKCLLPSPGKILQVKLLSLALV